MGAFMNFLCTFYPNFTNFPVQCSQDKRFQAWPGAPAHSILEEEMPVTIAMALLGAGGIAFYIRFFVALTRERKVHKWTGGHWIRLRLDSDEDPILEHSEHEKKNSHAA